VIGLDGKIFHAFVLFPIHGCLICYPEIWASVEVYFGFLPVQARDMLDEGRKRGEESSHAADHYEGYR
jgi:hypothetical protein